MEFVSRKVQLEKVRTGCPVVLVYEDGQLSPEAEQLDQLSQGAVSQQIKQTAIEGKLGQTLLLPWLPGVATGQALLLGAGKDEPMSVESYQKLLLAAANSLDKAKVKQAVLFIDAVAVNDQDSSWCQQQIGLHFSNAVYHFAASKADAKPHKPGYSKVVLASASRKAKAAMEQGAGIAAGIACARTLGNLPGNVCTPSYLAKEARSLARKSAKLSVKVVEEKAMQQLGMGALLSVTAGTDEAAKLIVLEYKGAAKTPPQVLVGKGVTFDSGGISLKPGAAMDEMKYDMCGAASVMGAFTSLVAIEPDINVVGIIGAVENMPSGCATKPGDVITSMAGLTIEVLNTDAEGRLVLCDALTYAERYKPKAVIDIATLTGACVVSLGKHATGLFSNNDELADSLLAAGGKSHDRAWRMPLWDDYHKQLESNFADLANIGGPGGGSITAACFLSRFAKKYPWAHLDIAGTAWVQGGQKGATGRPVALLMQYLLDQ